MTQILTGLCQLHVQITFQTQIQWFRNYGKVSGTATGTLKWRFFAVQLATVSAPSLLNHTGKSSEVLFPSLQLAPVWPACPQKLVLSFIPGLVVAGQVFYQWIFFSFWSRIILKINYSKLCYVWAWVKHLSAEFWPEFGVLIRKCFEAFVSLPFVQQVALLSETSWLRWWSGSKRAPISAAGGQLGISTQALPVPVIRGGWRQAAKGNTVTSSETRYFEKGAGDGDGAGCLTGGPGVFLFWGPTTHFKFLWGKLFDLKITSRWSRTFHPPVVDCSFLRGPWITSLVFPLCEGQPSTHMDFFQLSIKAKGGRTQPENHVLVRQSPVV